MSTAIHVSDVGPVTNLSIPVPDNGGVVVLRGRNGAGKSTALNAVDSLVTKSTKVTTRDGCARGTVEAFGATLRVGKRSSRTGELEVLSLDGRLSPADLVDPGLKSADAADNARIKASACRDAVADVDTSCIPDQLTLQDTLEAAIRRESSLKAEESSAAAARENAQRAQQAMDSVDAVKSLDLTPEIAAAQDAVRKSEQASFEASEDVVDAQRALREAEASVARAVAQHERCTVQWEADSRELKSLQERAEESRQAAESYESAVAGWQETIRVSERCVCPSPGAIEAAATAVCDAREAIEAAAVARHARDELSKASAHDGNARELRKRAERLRDAARGTDGILSDLVGRCGTSLQVRGGRLYVETSRGVTLFGDLSHGERWCIVLDIALQSFPPDSEYQPLLTIPQEAWEGLDPVNQEQIARHAQHRHVLVLAARCSDGPLTAEVFQVVGDAA